ncbi:MULTISPECIES: PTS glucose transporter subunit IIA [Vagococcus]|uniref:PTS system, maltose and glucose-specific IIC component / PTS system, maltose and glucose-specific IIB component / PTS system, maltose and glucose-specific IIA component n=1 Tax=Vagococcus fluvialis bH819 TaxID=1255619 RepID=A0A1X6WQX7_9ENTE|nr:MULTISPECIES: PTS glucose transporter subunit IIA [Vagococcus]SLM86704.1 PTS system, maltose and glucose-specific IIC component / PTS system, maltose and glucose-specific IIB component / PTS system, maltose and glucose-specific IIA component [Vagococcus fluvialis bH819]HCM90912.1 PTS N-acetylglucosamine transporter subunit IIABC [Vagococcus sp.]
MFGIFKKNKKAELEATSKIYAVAAGEVVSIDKVNDPVFSQKMMGDGFAVIPTNGDVYSPVAGEIMSIFPTKHALGIKMANGLEILLHMGIDTVELGGEPFDIKVKEGDKVTSEKLIAKIDLEFLASAGKPNDIVVAITNTADKLENIELTKLGTVTAGEVIGEVSVK